jgi:hypothetical protein
MAKKPVNIAGHNITQLTETTYEADNPQESLDFYFDTEDPEEVEVKVFDSTISNKSGQDPLLGVWYAESLEEAVKDCMTFTKKTMKGYEWFK